MAKKKKSKNVDDVVKMDHSNAGKNDSMGMDMSGSEKDNDDVSAKELQLEQMRTLQRQSDQAYQHEIAAQKKEDAKAHTLMEQNPRAHIAMMKMEQKHRQLALELPRQLLQHEAHVYQELQTAQTAAQAKMPETGKLMMEMVAMSRGSQIPLLVVGLWLIVSPFSLGYRSIPMIWSDVISGFLVTALAVIAFRTKRVWAAWPNTDQLGKGVASRTQDLRVFQAEPFGNPPVDPRAHVGQVGMYGVKGHVVPYCGKDSALHIGTAVSDLSPLKIMGW